MAGGDIGEVDPKTAWSALASDGESLLFDVRTRAEWSFVGAPDLSSLQKPVAFIEWQSFPMMNVNERFGEEAIEAVKKTGATTAYFLCRSGARSMSAAFATSAAAREAGVTLTCVNVAQGFEGDLGHDGKRGAINGWKANGLPWRQS